TVRNIYDFQKKLDQNRLLIAVHIRMTDFVMPTRETDFRGLWNTRIPLDWYTRVCRSLKDQLGEAVTFFLVSDGTPEELAAFIAEFKPMNTFDQQQNVVSDLLLMASADMLICSISSFSQWAAFLSNAPYAWYLPHLQST